MAKLQNLQNINGEWVYLDYGARTIHKSSEDALEVAKAVGHTITMAFNAARVKVTGNEASPKDVSDAYFAECDRMDKEYANSPEGKQAAARAAAVQKREQQAIDNLAGKLDEAIRHGIAGVIDWFAAYAHIADNNTIDGRGNDVLQKLKAAGYRSDFDASDEEIEKDLRAKGLLIIGQCMAFMEGGMPPHPGYAAGYIAEYNELRKTIFIPVMHPLTLNGKTPPPETIQLVPKLKLKPPQS